MLVALLPATSQAQNVVGDWELQTVDIQATEAGEDPGLTEETCLWRDLVEMPEERLSIQQDGSVSLSIDRVHPTIHYEVSGGILILHITNPYDKVSQMRYDVLRQGDQMILSRQDPLVTERYVFQRR